MDKELVINVADLLEWINRPPSNDDLDLARFIATRLNKFYDLEKIIKHLNKKYSKALELLINYNIPCEVDDFMNANSGYCETHCGIDEEQYKNCWDRFIEWKLGSDKS